MPATFPMIVGVRSQNGSTSTLALVAARVGNFGAALVEAHELGVPPGALEPWTAEFHRGAVCHCRSHLPDPFLRWLVSVYRSASRDLEDIGTSDAALLARHSHALVAAIEEQVPREACEAHSRQWVLTSRLPSVVPFTALASMVTRSAAHALMGASRRVAADCYGSERLGVLPAEQLRWLAGLASGMRVIDLAIENGYCERSMYRKLRSLWSTLNVGGREEAIALAARRGWI